MAKAKIRFGVEKDMKQLSARSTKIQRQLHHLGLGISIIMLITTLVLLGNAAYKACLANQDFVGGTVTHKTMSGVNQIVACVLLMMVTSMTALVFFRLYRAKSPFSRGNIVILRVVALILMLLSFLPITVQLLVAHLYNITIGISINFIYIFIGVIFYCISYMFEQGNIIQITNADAVSQREDLLLTYAEMAEAKSGLTGQHIKRISEYTRILAKNYGLSDEEVEKLRMAAMFHNIGKLMIPTEILGKESTLSDEEFAIMKTHVVAGDQLLHHATDPVLVEARKMALEHHENWNGHGYLGKQGEEISLPARIVAVADMFDALISSRSYKTGWEPNKVYSTIIDESGKKLDPEVVKTFIMSYREMLEVYNTYKKTGTREHELPKDIEEAYDKILGQYSKKTEEVETEVIEKNYQDVELDLRRLI